MFSDKDTAGLHGTSEARSNSKGDFVPRAVIEAAKNAAASHKATEESALLSAINNCQDGVVIGDLWGYISHVNKAIVKMYGAVDESEFLGKHVLNFLAKEDRSKVVAESLDSISTGQGRTQMLRVLSKNGKELLLEVTMDLIKTEDGEKIGFVNVIRDVSNRKLAVP